MSDRKSSNSFDFSIDFNDPVPPRLSLPALPPATSPTAAVSDSLTVPATPANAPLDQTMIEIKQKLEEASQIYSAKLQTVFNELLHFHEECTAVHATWTDLLEDELNESARLDALQIEADQLTSRMPASFWSSSASSSMTRGDDTTEGNRKRPHLGC